jgi:prevent-host-death family protein
MATWQLQTAKARLSELLRKVREEGPQTITVRGKEEYVVTLKAPANDASPRTWDELSALAQGAGDALILPPREPEPLRHFELEEISAEWQRQSDEEG